jgi:hypothetical protein
MCEVDRADLKGEGKVGRGIRGMDLARSEVQEEAVQVEGAANAQSPRQEYV